MDRETRIGNILICDQWGPGEGKGFASRKYMFDHPTFQVPKMEALTYI